MGTTERSMKIVIAATLFLTTYVATLHLLQRPAAETFSGSSGMTTSPTFTIEKDNWDISITYFKNWSPFWNLKIEVYAEGQDDAPLFSTHTILYTDPSGRERAELASHHSLPGGSYYLKVYSENVSWTLAIIKGD